MGLIDSLENHANKALDHGEEYILKTQEYYELKIFQQLSNTTSIFAKIAIIGSLVSLGFLLLLVASTIALANAIDSYVYACLINAGILFFLAFVLYLLREKIDKSIIQKMSKQYFN